MKVVKYTDSDGEWQALILAKERCSSIALLYIFPSTDTECAFLAFAEADNSRKTKYVAVPGQFVNLEKKDAELLLSTVLSIYMTKENFPARLT